MKPKRFISLILCVSLVFGSCVFAFAADTQLKTVSEPVRIIDGIGESLSTVFTFFNFRKNYPECSKKCSLFEVEKGYVPQGFCYIDSENLFAVSYYSEEKNSIIVLINAQTGERVKTLNLCYDDGSPCKSHAGGVTDIGDSVLISSGKSLRRLKVEDMLSAGDYSDICFCGTLKTHMQASYAGSYKNTLLIGQFYSFTLNGTYDTPADQRLYVPGGGRNYAMCEVCDLSDIDAAFEKGEAEPEFVISMPNSVQGITFDGSRIITSSSYGTFGTSKLKYYNADFAHPDASFTIGGRTVPLVFLSKSNLDKTVTMPPMLEGIDIYNGKVAGIFESCASKFKLARVRISDICILSELAQ